ncbi:MAG: TetR/AcrR family transcriptional regulator [Sphingobacteriales bacterium]|nr:MAG: TetR/AcrR family transcriptional regulator [Sphingobacteriales bacterium]
MEWQIYPKMNTHLYLRNPENTEIGKKIINVGVKLISENGFEIFTFKKLADAIGSTEATIYRYFENKHKLLTYIVDWYWYWLDYQVVFHTNNIESPQQKLEIITAILTSQQPQNTDEQQFINNVHLQKIIITDSTKTYLNHQVTELNKIHLFKPYKDLCARIGNIILELKPDYKFSKSLSSSIIEIAHFQEFFMLNLPSLTDFGKTKDLKSLQEFLNSLIFNSLK